MDFDAMPVVESAAKESADPPIYSRLAACEQKRFNRPSARFGENVMELNICCSVALRLWRA